MSHPNTSELEGIGEDIILTPTVTDNLRDLILALTHRQCVLLRGTVGCGKSTMARAAAKHFKQDDSMIRISLDDSFDSKDLIGKFTASTTPGAFEWRPGPLAIAVQEGRWLLMEDIDLASFDVLTALNPLLSEGKIFVPEKAQYINAAPGFKLIATQQCVSGPNGVLFGAKNSAPIPNLDLWSSVSILQPSPDELLTIVSTTYGVIPISILSAMITAMQQPTKIKAVADSLQAQGKASTAASPRGELNQPVTVTAATNLSLRDILKWARRVAIHLGDASAASPTSKAQPSNPQGKAEFLASQRREAIFREAVDAFCSRFPTSLQKDAVIACAAEACGVPLDTALSMTRDYKPAMNAQPEALRLTIGRTTVDIKPSEVGSLPSAKQLFAPTKVSLVLMEQLATAVALNEPVLLTGETGVGKTFIVQQLANLMNRKLVVHNVNQQTDSSDLIGGWKPQDLGKRVNPLARSFLLMFLELFDPEKNADFINKFQHAFEQRSWEFVLRSILSGATKAKKKLDGRSQKDVVAQREQQGSQGSGEVSEMARDLVNWETLAKEASKLHPFAQANAAMFEFEEGSLIRAWKEGWWILLDEVNLATTEVLERIAGVVGEAHNLVVTERSDAHPLPRHPDFRVFANMNPPTDVGKKDLPPALRSKFTEFYVEEPFSEHDLSIVVTSYLGQLVSTPPVAEVVKFFQECVRNSRTLLSEPDGESRPPHFSLRTLTRALSYVRSATPLYGFRVALFDGLMMGFGTSVARKFQPVVEQLLMKTVFHRDPAVIKPTIPRKPEDGKQYVALEHLWLTQGPLEPYVDPRFILTGSVSAHLKNVARAVASNRPVLLEGPTSSGKSSIVKYLAERTGHQFVRINNHETTEVQEYLGHYVSDESGKLRFVDGVLVTAVREGHWVVLDELNLAPTEVLEALNRLLDDNAELLIPDTQEVIKAHPHLRIFATQNPSGLYGGRKTLSRAFRNRFLEIIVDDMPSEELQEVLTKRYQLAPTFAEKMVQVMVKLQQRRQNSQLFAGRHGFITPRDLFRWAERNPKTYMELAMHGLLLLGDRCRKNDERQVVKDTIESIMKVDVEDDKLYNPENWEFTKKFVQLLESPLLQDFHLVWTPSMKRLFTVTGLCLQNKEPILLVGETGASKTTICQVWARLLELSLHLINCHQHSEAADFLGALRPNAPELRHLALFAWFDGPLVRSMKEGSMFVLDEISLAEDSVLERLNSVLEPSRQLTLAEKSDAEVVTAAETFRVLATMNPSGDFGKKELSPALRNRFTEIYVQPVRDIPEVTLILSKRLPLALGGFAEKLAYLLHQTITVAGFHHISIRDIVALSDFMRATENRCDPNVAFIHGIDAVLLDGSGVGAGQSEASVKKLRRACLELAANLTGQSVEEIEATLAAPFWELCQGLEKPSVTERNKGRYSFDAKTTERNISKILRCFVMPKPILLEGSPGVGKTSVVEALGPALGKRVVRINLSDQTDMMDLLGAFLPTADGFQWCDGILLTAVKQGDWVILDELNLANQTVLEGLNALLDHRSTIYLPELCKEVQAGPGLRVFGCQNPLVEGGGRKGLPRSFLNRFSRVHIEPFTRDDLLLITNTLCPDFPQETIERMVTFVSELHWHTSVQKSFGLRGGPFEFNLRDTLRWASFLRQHHNNAKQAYPNAVVPFDPATVLDFLFLARFRTAADREKAQALYERIFETKISTFRPTLILAGYLENSAAGEGDEPKQPVLCVDGIPTLLRDDMTLSPSNLCLLPSQSHAVAAILRCVAAQQFCYLVGPQSCGKSSILRVAALLAGRCLKEIPTTAGCDTVDLLGGFDQVEGKPGTFVWKDSTLVQAMEQGHWAVLDNANFCNASVLDRLNPLVEPNGVLMMNEQGLIDGQVRIVRAHPNFRLFLTSDPKFGEISRAMRNRAVEIYVPPMDPRELDAMTVAAMTKTNDSNSILGELNELAVLSLAEFHGVYMGTMYGVNPPRPFTQRWAGDFSRLADSLSTGAPTLRTLLHAAKMFTSQTEGKEWTAAELAALLYHHYLRNRVGSVPLPHQEEHLKLSLQTAVSQILSNEPIAVEADFESAPWVATTKPILKKGVIASAQLPTFGRRLAFPLPQFSRLQPAVALSPNSNGEGENIASVLRRLVLSRISLPLQRESLHPSDSVETMIHLVYTLLSLPVSSQLSQSAISSASGDQDWIGELRALVHREAEEDANPGHFLDPDLLRQVMRLASGEKALLHQWGTNEPARMALFTVLGFGLQHLFSNSSSTEARFHSFSNSLALTTALSSLLESIRHFVFLSAEHFSAQIATDAQLFLGSCINFLRLVTPPQGATDGFVLTHATFVNFATALTLMNDQCASFTKKHDSSPLLQSLTPIQGAIHTLAVECIRYLMLPTSDLLAEMQLWRYCRPPSTSQLSVKAEASADPTRDAAMKPLWMREHLLRLTECIVEVQMYASSLASGSSDSKDGGIHSSSASQIAELIRKCLAGNGSGHPQQCCFSGNDADALQAIRHRLDSFITQSNPHGHLTLMEVLPLLNLAALTHSGDLSRLIEPGSWLKPSMSLVRSIGDVKLREFAASGSASTSETTQLAGHLAQFFGKDFRFVEVVSLLKLFVQNDLTFWLQGFGLTLAAVRQHISGSSATPASLSSDMQFVKAFPLLQSLVHVFEAQEAKISAEATSPSPTPASGPTEQQLESDNLDLVRELLLYGSWKCTVHCPVTLVDPLHKRHQWIADLTGSLEYWQKARGWMRQDDVIVRDGDFSEAVRFCDQFLELLHSKRIEASAGFHPREDGSGQQFYVLAKKLQELSADSGFAGFQRTSQMLRIVDSIARTVSHSASAAGGAELDAEQLQGFIEQFGAFASALQQCQSEIEHFKQYDDITVPFGEGLLLLSLGALIGAGVADRVKRKLQAADQATSYARPLDFLSYPTTKPRVGVFAALRTQQAQSIFPLLQALDSSLQTVESDIPWLSHHKDKVFALFSQYRLLFGDIERLREKELEAEQSKVLYKEKVQVIAGDDERALKRMRELFPSYVATFTAQLQDPSVEGDENAEADDVPVAAPEDEDDAAEQLFFKTARHARLLLLEGHSKRLRRLTDTHRRYFQYCVNTLYGSLDATSTARSLTQRTNFPPLFEAGLAALKPVVDQLSIRSTQEPQLVGGFGAYAQSLSTRLLQIKRMPLSDDITIRVSEGFNIYLDPEPSEMVHAVASLGTLLNDIRQSPFFVESHVLQRIALLVHQILALPLERTPLMRVLTGFELTVKECYEWERNASKDVSLIQHITTLSKWILRWRRLELHCWDHLFVAKDHALKGQAAANWFSFHDICSDVAMRGVVDVSEVFALIHAVLWKSNLGEFPHRLEVIRSFAYQAETEWHLRQGRAEKTVDPVGTAFKQLSNLFFHAAAFFSQFLTLCVTAKSNVMNPLTEQLNAFCAAMTWQDATFHALQASTEKSHLQVCRVLSKLDEGLNQAFNQIVTNEEKRCDEDPAMGVLVGPKTKKQLEKEEARRKKKEEELKKKKVRKSKRGEKSDRAEEEDAQIATTNTTLWTSDAIHRAIEFLDDVCTEVVHQVAELQKPKTPQNVKTRALKLLFDAAEQAGLKVSSEETPSPWALIFASLPWSPERTPAPVSDAAIALPNAAAQQTDDYFYRCAHQLQRMREQAAQHHPDLTTAQVRRATSICEGLLRDCISQRNSIHQCERLLKEVTLVQRFVEELEVPAPSTSFRAHQYVIGLTELSFALRNWCVEARSLTTDTVQVLPALSDMEIVNDRLSKELAEVTRVSGSSRLFMPSVSDISLHKIAVLANDILRILKGLTESDDEKQPAPVLHPALEATAKSLLARFSHTTSLLPTSVANSLEIAKGETTQEEGVSPSAKRSKRRVEDTGRWRTSLTDRLTNLETQLKQLAVAIAAAQQQGSQTEVQTEEAGETADTDRSTSGYFALYSDGCSTHAAIHHFLETASWESLIQPNLHQVDSVQARRDLLSRLTLVITQLKDLLGEIQSLHHHCSKAAFILGRLFATLFKKGFCKTEDEEDGDGEGEGDSGQNQQGTGMDDGQGEKDVTDQIENEDQLMNQKDLEEQNEEKDQKEDGKDQDRAKEVETNFEGQKENMEPEGENEESDENDEESDMDDEKGSVGEDDAPTRKKQRTEEKDPALDEDEGGDAEDVPEDEFDKKQDGDDDEETADYGNKEDKIKEGKENKEDDSGSEKEHELVGLDEQAEMDEDDSNNGSDRESSTEGSNDESDKDSNKEEKEEEEGDRPDEEGVDDRLETNSQEQQENPDGDDKEEGGEDGSDKSDADGEDDNDGYDKDQNVFDGGQQDDQTGQEDTEQPQEKMKKKPQDTAGGEEQQSGEQQDVSEAGRQWKQRKMDDRSAKKDQQKNQQRSEAQQKSALQQAVQRRDWRKVQALNLEKSVKLKDDEAKEDDEAPQEEGMAQEQDFELHEDGKEEGLLATDKQHVTEANEKELKDEKEELDEDQEEDAEGKAPEDQGTRRKKKADVEAGSDEDQKEGEDDDKKKKKKGKGANRMVRQLDSSEDEEEPRLTDEPEETLDEKLRRGREMWLQHESATQHLSQQLCEQLRLILDPTVADKLQGDYKTGKRINIKKIIPYIASQYKKDRIWLRRTKASKRSYQVLIALDDSQSMKLNQAGDMSLQAVALISRALQQLDIGEFGLLTFGKTTQVVHPLDQPFIHDSGPRAFSEILFDQPSTNMKVFLQTALDYMDVSRSRSSAQTRSTSTQLMQICFVITDGQLTENRAELRKLVARAEANRQVIVLIILDVKAQPAQTSEAAAAPAFTPAQGASTAAILRGRKAEREERLQEGKNKNRGSVVDMQMIEFVGQKVIKRNYLDDFPFSFYLIVRELQTLPEVLADAMRQWFELMTNSV